MIAKTRRPVPKSEQRWWAYDVDGTSVFIVRRKDDEHHLLEWRPKSSDSPRSLFTLQEASDHKIGEFGTISVSGETAIDLEGGRVWRLDLEKQSATWLKNDTRVSSGSFTPDGAYYFNEGSLTFTPFGDGEIVDISKQVRESDYQLNSSFTKAHHTTGDSFVVWNDHVVYIAQRGVFAYGMEDGEVHPILLTPRPEVTEGDVRVVYRNLTVLENGMLFVQGLESESGAVGVEGPIYRMHLEEYDL